MDTSYQNVDRPFTSGVSDQPVLESKSVNKGGYLLIALGIIALIGSLVAAGCLYSQLGYTSFAIGGAGVVLCILSFLLSKYCCVSKTTVTHDTQPNKKGIPNQADIRVDETPIQKPNTSRPRNDSTSFQSPNSALPKTKNKEPQLHNRDISQDKKVDAPPQTTAIPPKIEIPDLPPLPPIFNLKLDESNPLLKALPSAQFLKPSKDMSTFLFGSALVGGVGPEQLFGDNVLDNELLDIPLSFWINQDLKDYNAVNHLKVMSDPTRKHPVEVINTRIKALDQAIQFTERLQRLKYSYLKVRDLLAAWDDSRLKLMLMMDDELSSLKVSSIAQLGNGMVWDALGSRLLTLGRKKQDFAIPVSFTKESIEEILLIDLPKLKVQHIRVCPADFPPITFLLIDFSELQQIETNRLSTDQLHFIFSSVYYNERITRCYYVQLLKPTQINSCIPLIKDKKLFANLSEEQALKFDFSQMDQEIFNAVFDLYGADSSTAAKLLPKLDIDRIYELSPFFSKDHWKCIGKKHTLIFDFSKIEEPKRQEVFDIIFTTYGATSSTAAELLPKLDINRIYELSTFFSNDHWKLIGDKHILAYDFSKIPEPKRQGVFNILFNTYGGSYSEAAKLLPKLSNNQSDIVRPYLGPEALKHLK